MTPSTPAQPALARTVLGSGPAVLLAHGAGGGLRANYGPALNALAAHHTVIGVDFPGSGESAVTSSPLELDDMADRLVAAATAEGHERFAVVGYSLGTAVALRAAARHPGRVTAIVLTAPFAAPNTRLRLNAELWRDLYRAGEYLLLAKFMVPLAWNSAVLDGLSPEELETIIRTTAHTLPAGSADQADLVARTDVRADLAEVTVPALVISTTADALVPSDLHREVADGLVAARLVDIDTGHLPFVEKPAEWTALMTEFLREQAVSGSPAQTTTIP